MIFLKFSRYLLASGLIATPIAFAEASSTQWQELNNQASAFAEANQYQLADPVDYEHAIAIAEQAIVVAEKDAGTQHPDVAISLSLLAKIHLQQGKYGEAEAPSLRALAIREKAFGPDAIEVTKSLDSLASLYRNRRDYVKAEPYYRRSLTMNEKILGANHPEVASSLNNLALFFLDQNQYGKAEPLFKRSLHIFENSSTDKKLDLAMCLGNLALLYIKKNEPAKAEPFFQRALSIYEEKFGTDSAQVAKYLVYFARMHQQRDDFSSAEPLYLRTLAIREKDESPNDREFAIVLDNLANFYIDRADYQKAEALLKRALTTLEKSHGYENEYLHRPLNNLALLYFYQLQYDKAEPLYIRSLALAEKFSGYFSEETAITLMNFSGFYNRLGQYAKAENYATESLTILEKIHGPEASCLGTGLSLLAEIYDKQGQYEKAEPIYLRALKIQEKMYGAKHSQVAYALKTLAVLYTEKGEYSRAEPLYSRAIAILEAVRGSDHPDVASLLNYQAANYYNQDKPLMALPLLRRMSAIYRQRILDGSIDAGSNAEAALNRGEFFLHLTLLSDYPAKENPDHITDEAFQLSQLDQATGTGDALAQMAARFANGDDAIADLIKRKQDAILQREKNDTKLVTATSLSADDRDASYEQGLRGENDRLKKEIATVVDELTLHYPEYQELTRPEPLSVSQVQATLRPTEAMLVYHIDKHDSWIWIVRTDKSAFQRLETDQQTLSTQVRRVRLQMSTDKAGRLGKVDLSLLHKIHEDIIAPAKPFLDKVDHLILVASGPLQSLPFAMLVASAANEISSHPDYRDVDWLAKHYAISVLPSVSSIRALRHFGDAGRAPLPFIGFGDPLLAKLPKQAETASRSADLTGLFRSADNAKGEDWANGIADVALIKQQPSLPESAEEINAMASMTKAESNAVWLQEKATETNVKKLDLSKYRTIAFATHGVMADEFGKGMEPGLLLTPPKQGSLDDDGYLSAGEIAKLKLNADWVLLSACNTASSDGAPGADGLSGLAKAFFYAGTRSLLVSHWPVSSAATVPLTTAMLLEYEKHPELGKAEAHRKSMLALMNTAEHPEYSHPIFWAPFVVVGEGGIAGDVVETGK